MTPTTMDDVHEQKLIQGLKAHESWACEELIERFADMVYRVCYRILQNPQEAEDAMQETFITVYRRIDSFRGDAKLSSWLYRVATNMALSMLRSNIRKQGRDLSLENDEDDERPLSDAEVIVPETFILQQENRALLEQGLEAMSPKLRAALMLYEIEGFSMKETAQALGVSESAAKLRVHRGRQFLQKYLAQYYEEVMT